MQMVCWLMQILGLLNPPIFHRLGRFPVESAAFEGFAFVVEFFSLGQSDGEFGPIAFVEVEHQGDDGKALFVDLAVERVELLFVQQQLAGSPFVSGEVAVGGLQVADVGIKQPEFAFDEAAVGVIDIDPSLPQGLDFATLELDAGFVFLQDLIFVSGFFVLGDDFDGHGSAFTRWCLWRNYST